MSWGGLLMSSPSVGWQLTGLTSHLTCNFSTIREPTGCRDPRLKADIAGPNTAYLVSQFIFHRNDLVNPEVPNS
jgi:hypothetical protein